MITDKYVITNHLQEILDKKRYHWKILLSTLLRLDYHVL